MGLGSGGMMDFLRGLPVVGGLVPGQSSAEQMQQAAMREAAAAYQAMRPEVAAARAQALQNVMGGIAGPGNQMMGQVYGQDAMMDFGLAGQQPLTPGMLGVGAPPPQEPQPGETASEQVKRNVESGSGNIF